MNLREWNALRASVLSRDDAQCQKCGSKLRLEVHHVVPRHLDGDDELSNLITFCKKCHSKSHPRESGHAKYPITKTFQISEEMKEELEGRKEINLAEVCRKAIRAELDLRK
jgi:5-methylcytosine-specific restriction endonuclease McrA